MIIKLKEKLLSVFTCLALTATPVTTPSINALTYKEFAKKAKRAAITTLNFCGDVAFCIAILLLLNPSIITNLRHSTRPQTPRPPQTPPNPAANTTPFVPYPPDYTIYKPVGMQDPDSPYRISSDDGFE